MPDDIEPVDPKQDSFKEAMRACGAVDLGNCWEWEADDFHERLYAQARADLITKLRQDINDRGVDGAILVADVLAIIPKE